MPKKYAYMHTINGHPAEYIEGGQIEFLEGRKMVSSMKEIVRQQKLSRQYRKNNNYIRFKLCYGHIRFEL